LSSALLQDIVIKKGEQEGVGGVTIGRIPLMLRSDRCVLKGKSEDELASLGDHFDCALVFPCILECSCNSDVLVTNDVTGNAVPATLP
jgi:RNA polymerase beta subunit